MFIHFSKKKYIYLHTVYRLSFTINNIVAALPADLAIYIDIKMFTSSIVTSVHLLLLLCNIRNTVYYQYSVQIRINSEHLKNVVGQSDKILILCLLSYMLNDYYVVPYSDGRERKQVNAITLKSMSIRVVMLVLIIQRVLKFNIVPWRRDIRNIQTFCFEKYYCFGKILLLSTVI